MAQETFRRYEKKYRLSKEKQEALFTALQEKIRPDAYGSYTISNIYFDTADYSFIKRSLEKPDFKEKMRLRSYGVPDMQSIVYAELKKKYKGIVYKRRAALSLQEATDWLYSGKEPEASSQIKRELFWFTEHYFLKPAVYLAYDREAYAGTEDKFRLTFDTNIRYREQDLHLEKGDDGIRLLPEEEVLMEIKIQDAMPFWMSHLFSELEIFPTSFSKYGTYYLKKEKSVIDCGREKKIC